MTSLMIASKRGQTEVVKALLEGKVDPSTQEKVCSLNPSVSCKSDSVFKGGV